MKQHLVHSLSGMPKFIAGFIGTLAFRLASPFFGLWNISPLMATELAGTKAYGPWIGGLYGAGSMTLVDLLMGKIGSWTIVTSISYGLVGVVGAYMLRSRQGNAKDFVLVSIAGTLFFDLVTGVLMGPILFGQSWADAAIGQIPFTVRHLLGNIAFAALVAPWFYQKIMENPKWELSRLFKFA